MLLVNKHLFSQHSCMYHVIAMKISFFNIQTVIITQATSSYQEYCSNMLTRIMKNI